MITIYMDYSTEEIKTFLGSSSAEMRFHARQLMLNKIPLSYFVENYLYDNEKRPQSLTKFPMFREIYDRLPQRLLLKCSRKTLKSTILSNILCYNMLRANSYTQLYIANLEKTTKGFSKKYLVSRFDSPKVKEFISKPMWSTDDVFEKVLKDTNSGTTLLYCSEDATRIRSYSTHENHIDEIQNINYDELGIIAETLSILATKRQRYSGTPLSKANTLHRLWRETTQGEWMTRCGCGHWNWLGEGNEPEKMLLEQGYSCSKCGKLLDTMFGEWVRHDTSERNQKFIGYHLAQPMLPFYNQDPAQWEKIYEKVCRLDTMTLWNEVLGLAFDSASTKPITEDELKGACTLGRMYSETNKSELAIYEAHRRNYVLHTNGTDWGVNEKTSRTVSVQGGLLPNGVYEVYWMRNFNNLDYKSHIYEIARMASMVNAKATVDGGPDPNRGIMLAELMGGQENCQLIRYEHGKLIQRFDAPPDSDWRAHRWVLHRSDILSWTFRMIKNGRIVFPSWLDTEDFLRDLLNSYIEIREGIVRQEQYFRHGPDEPDDFLHAIAFAAASAFFMAGDATFSGNSSSSSDGNTNGTNE